MPTQGNISSSQVIKYGKKLFMVDCAEGAQNKMIDRKLGYQNIDTIFISHLHGDHMFGLIAILCVMNLGGRTKKLRIVSPHGLQALYQPMLDMFCTDMRYEYEFIEVDDTVETIVYEDSFLTVIAFPLSLLSAANLWPKHSPVPRIGKVILDILRSFPELVYAIIFVKMVGPGPFAGVMAIGVHQIGMLGKLFAEEMERLDTAPVEAMNAVETFFYARLPQLSPIYVSLILNHFEIGVRSASTLGLVGAGGIGAPLIFAIQARSWDKVGIILLAVIVTVYLLDIFTGWVRKQLR